jgi:hypothetical protein
MNSPHSELQVPNTDSDSCESLTKENEGGGSYRQKVVMIIVIW